MKTLAVTAFTAYAVTLSHQAADFRVADPQPVLHADLAYMGGTASIGERGYNSSPPEAPIEVKLRKMVGGAALPDS